VAGAGVFVYMRLRTDLDDGVHDSLVKRSQAITDSGRTTGIPAAAAGAPTDRGDGFSEVLAGSGRVLGAAGGFTGRALTGDEFKAAAVAPITLERRLPGVDGTTRILAGPGPAGGGGAAVIVVGQSLEDRDEALDGLIDSLTIGGIAAVLLASLAGYAIASAGFRPIERMRSQAGAISLAGEDELLTLPAARDEVHRLGETLNEMLLRLRASFERERSFVAEASHELRTPIAVVKAELEATLRSGELGPSARESVVAAIEECDGLSALAEDLLVLARIGGEGALPLATETADADMLLAEVRARYQDRAAEHDREIRIGAAEGLTLSVDRNRVRQALGNLVDNALRHGDGAIELGAMGADHGVALTVSDEGPGFDPTIANRAFERFARGETARGADGSGLGLAIVRAIVEAHDGTVAIVPGQGATVRVWLPAGPRHLGWSDQDAVQANRRRARGAHQGETKRG
jgi:two-component system, OmpR family, sensor kinase